MHNGRRVRTCVRCAQSCAMLVQTDRQIYIYIYIYIYKYRGISNTTQLLVSLRSLRSRRSTINHNNLTARVNVAGVSPSRSRFKTRFESGSRCQCEKGVWVPSSDWMFEQLLISKRLLPSTAVVYAPPPAG